MRSRLALRLIPIGIVTAAWTASWLYAWLAGAGLDGDNILWGVVAAVAGFSAFFAARRPDNRASALGGSLRSSWPSPFA